MTMVYIQYSCTYSAWKSRLVSRPCRNDKSSRTLCSCCS